MSVERSPVLRMALSACLLFMAAEPAAADAKVTKEPQPEVPRLLMPAKSAGPTQLWWRSGERISGELTGAADGHIEWKSELFASPLRVRNDVIRRVDFSASLAHPEGAFRLVLTDGSHLTGELDSVDDKALSFRSSRCGVLAITRDRIVCLERVRGAGIIAAGPHSLAHAGSARPATGATLYFTAGGGAAAVSFHQANHLSLELPAKCVIELLLRSDGVPEFSLSATAGDSTVAVETWDDELVLTSGDRFVSAGPRFGENDRRAHVRLAWDRNAARCALFGPDGTLWADLHPESKAPAATEEKKLESKPAGSGFSLKRLLFGISDPPRAPAPAKPAPGIRLHNKGNGMFVERFVVREWSGQPLPAVIGGKACLETESEIIIGELVARRGETLLVRLANGESRELPVPSVQAIRWPREPMMERVRTQSELWFSDGHFLRGRLMNVGNGKARVETAFATGPVTASLDHARAIVLPDPDKKPESSDALEKLDLLTSGRITLHGTMRFAGGTLPHFQPVGAAEAVVPAHSRDLSLSRPLPDGRKFERAPALLHVDGNESLPVKLTGVDRKKVEFAWDAAENHELDAGRVHAVQFTVPVAGTGFDQPGWQPVGDSTHLPARKGDALVLAPGTGIGHPFILQGADVNFRMKRSNMVSSIRVRLFTRGTDRSSGSLNFLIGDFGGTIYCGLERREGQLDHQGQVPSQSGSAQIRFAFSGDDVELYVNGVSACKTSRNARGAHVSGTGIVLESASLWGNQTGAATLSEFSTKASPYVAGPPGFSSEAMREALLLPRVHRDDPPRHVLIGRNGDLLRGEIEALSASHFLFRAGLESFKIPTDRVAAAVWLIKPVKLTGGQPKSAEAGRVVTPPAPATMAENVVAELLLPFIKSALPASPSSAPATPARDSNDGKSGASPVWLDLTNGGRVALLVETWNNDSVTGRHALLGQCKIPAALVHRVAVTAPPAGGGHAALSNWKLEPTPDPVLPEDESASSPLAGQPAPDFTLPLVEGGQFSPSMAKGKVVVLDFWATWCGPCVQSLPGLIEAMSAFPDDKVAFAGINQGETKEQVQKFLEVRNLSMPVALDADQSVAAKYHVDGIPHTVVIGRDGHVAMVKTGYSPEGEKQIAAAVRKALGE